ncbi:hypothetical protein SEA_FINKLE_41 [Gordonia phage Finkle]|uniref:Uncharacterized protein n=1 Tax=Gordonia phage Finkle TaxID=2926099 RepID=A0A9E7NJJ8_9CAUD|nr:hypothetical protein QEH33_gp41 [Gordonia phage Finkle]UTN93001.1 hypothetical protein SEA_FINKLE_41 [Gordonia phage Finkle]
MTRGLLICIRVDRVQIPPPPLKALTCLHRSGPFPCRSVTSCSSL